MATATRTVLFTDLAGYTARVSRGDRESLRRLLDEHHQTVAPIVDGNGGRIIKNLGDSYLCVLGSATDAVKAGLAIIEAMRTPSGDTIRVSVETGDIEEIDGDAFGHPVNIAARILGKTPAGELWFGPGTRACMTEAELAWDPVGRFAFKGIAGEPQCYRAVPAGRAWLDEPVKDAIAERRLVRLKPGYIPEKVQSDAVILMEDFEPGSDELQTALKSLPVLPAESVYLVATRVPAEDRIGWMDSGHHLLIGDAAGLKSAIDAFQAELSQSLSPGEADKLHASETMVVTGLTMLKGVELSLCGLALPRVPFSEIVSSYSYDLLPDGTWATRSDQGVLLRVDVRPDGVLLHALRRGLEVDGHALKAGTTITPLDASIIKTENLELRYQQLTGNYAGIIFCDTPTGVSVRPGQAVEIGRSPNAPGLALPSRPGKSNINWCTGDHAKRARARGFTLDRVLAGRRQAAVQISPKGLQLTPLHKTCPTYVLSNNELHQVREPERIGIGDRVVAGTNVIGLRAEN